MLTEGRFAAILSILQKQRTVMVLELTQALSTSGSTIRRGLATLHRMGKPKKVHGDATLLHKEYGLYETEMATRSEEYVEEERRITRYAVSLIQVHDFVYISAESTTLRMMEYLKEGEAIYVTNGLEYGGRLAVQGFRTFLLADELKSKTEVVVGFGAISSLQKYNFNKVLLGTNDITVNSGLTTPGTNEAYVKVEAMKYAQKYYMLVDFSKFGTYTSIATADIGDATIIVGRGVEKEHLEEAGMIEVEERSVQ